MLKCSQLSLYLRKYPKTIAKGTGNREQGTGSSNAEVRPVANYLIRLRKAHHYGLGGFPHERLHQYGSREYRIKIISINLGLLYLLRSAT
ncbi:MULTISPECIES: hypothetical protein [Moorena]|uniref:hypothetical protein n=1 Tax=Moorena TaxID=1155738 RepID=UPI00117FB18F|nr:MULTISPECIES: hypothetical protein [Moorena]NEP29829.1 hypothetical protein [Moorena sp. SIO3I6]